MTGALKYYRKSNKYKHVYLYYKERSKGVKQIVYQAVLGKGRRFFFKSEREAAISVDKSLIEKGNPPVNILKNIKDK